MTTDPALMSAETLLSLYASRELSPIEALAAVTERVMRLNPRLNAFAVMNRQAIVAAGESEARWNAGRPIGILDGVPCTVKDLLDMAGFPTRRGSRLTDPAPVKDDAPAVMGLKAAGAVIIGKTTTTEFGWKTPGDNPLHGITRNPWNTDYTPGGSSSGAGPAGAFAAVACAGPMTRTVRDNALMFSAMARYDFRDPFCLPDDDRDWRDGIEAGVAGLRVGVLSNPGFAAPIDAAGVAAVERAALLLADAGARIESLDTNFPDIGLPDTSGVFGRVWGVALARLVASFPEDKRHLLDPGLLEVAAAEGGMSAMEFLGADALRATAGHAMARLHQRYDLVLCPTVPHGPLLADAPTENPVDSLWQHWAPWTFLFNLTRQPAISVPMGLGENGLPLSVQIAAAQFRDDLVFRAARAIEIAQPFPALD